MSPPTTDEVFARFNQAFANHDAGLLADLVGQDCSKTGDVPLGVKA
jgi:hypothetical protein